MSIRISAPRDLGKNMQEQLRAAMMRAGREVADELKRRARERIRATTKGDKFANAFRVRVMPSKVDGGMTPFIVAWRRASYSEIFEEGGTIRPVNAKFLWLPLPGTLDMLGMKARTMTDSTGSRRYIAGRVAAKGAQLVFIPPKNGNPPLLAAKYTKTKKGRAGTFRPKSARGQAALQNASLRPLFFGLPSSTIRIRWQIKKLADEIWQTFPQRVYQNL